MGAEPVLQIRLLGGFETRVGSQIVPSTVWRQRRAAAIVKLLALEPSHGLHREQLLETLWPDFEPESASNNLRVALHHARLGLEQAGAPAGVFLVREGERLDLGPREQVLVDLESFAEAASRAWQSDDPAIAENAAALYGGDLLPEDPYEDWAASRREGLRASYLSLLNRLASLHERQGRLSPAIAALERIAAADPVDEAAHAGLMRLHAQTGNRQLALGQYARLKAILNRELGAIPEQATETLAEAIREGRIETIPAHPTVPLPESKPQPKVASITPSARLPGPYDALVGRERELAELGRLLTTARLVTLTGAGGIGKTRLAVEAAKAFNAHSPDGVAFVDLAPLQNPSIVLPTIAHALGIDETGNHPVSDLIVALVGDRSLVLVLDNFEHLVSAGPDVASLLSRCPHLTVLTTSRVRLRLRSEQEYPVMPLPLPESMASGQPPSLSELSQVPAIELFTLRAEASRPSFVLNDENVADVAEICRRLDGLPLAIELAAAQVRVLTPAQLLRRLERPLDVLGTTAPDVPTRQRTLRATLTWSHDLLNNREQMLFRRLSVFAGSWSLEGTEAIANINGHTKIDPVETLGRLIDHSLVETRSGASVDELRYFMLQTLREFATERLLEAGELIETEHAFESFLLNLVVHAEQGMQGPEQASWLDRLDVEHDNIRAVLGRDLQRESSEFALRLTLSLWRFWLMRGYPGEGRAWLERVLANSASAPALLRAGAQHALGHLAIELGNYDEAGAQFEASLALSREVEDRRCRADALSGLGVVALNRQKYSEARTLLEEAHDIRRQLNDRNGIAWSLYYLGIVAREWGDYGPAGDFFREALAMWRQQGNPERIGYVLIALAMVSRFQGDQRAARPMLEEGLSVMEKIGHRYGVAVAHEQLGHIARLEGDALRALHHYVDSLFKAKELGANELAVEAVEFSACAATALGQPLSAGHLFSAATKLRSDFSLPAPMDSEVITLEQHKARAERAAGQEWASVWSEGQTMSLEQAAVEASDLPSKMTDVAATSSGG